MKLEPLSCNNCGAPLEVPPTANYVTCAHCGSRLAVKRTDTAHYTEVLERLDNLDTRTEDMEAEINRLRIENAIMNLDQEWEVQRKLYLTSSREGPVEPSLTRVGVYGFSVVLTIGMVCFWTIAATPMSIDGGMVIGLVMLLAGGVTGWLAVGEYFKYRGYKAAESAYLAQREQLVNERWRSREQQASAGELVVRQTACGKGAWIG